MLTKLAVLAAKIETTIGTAIAVTAADAAFNAYDVKISADIPFKRREAQGSFDSLTGTLGAYSGKCTFKIDVEWSGTGIPAWASTFLPACGYVASSQVYTPRSENPGTNVKTLTMAAYKDGVVKQIVGAMGTFKIVAKSGDIVTFEFEFTGVWTGNTDAALLDPTLPTPNALRFASSTITNNAVAQCVEQVSFDAGNKVILRECPSTAAGYISALITDREPKITINPEAQLVADEDRYGDWLSGTERAFSCAIDGPTDSAMTLAAPKAQYMKVEDGDRNGIAIDDIELMCNYNAGTKDEDVSLTFTDAS